MEYKKFLFFFLKNKKNPNLGSTLKKSNFYKNFYKNLCIFTKKGRAFQRFCKISRWEFLKKLKKIEIPGIMLNKICLI